MQDPSEDPPSPIAGATPLGEQAGPDPAMVAATFLVDPLLNDAAFATLAENLPTLCWMGDAEGFIFWYNRGWYDYTGATPAQMEGWGWRSVHDPAALPDVMTRWTGAIASGEPFDMTFPLRRHDGVYRPFLTRARPLRDADGRVTRWFGVNIDVTAQHEAELALRESESRFRNMADHAPVMMWTTDPTGYCTYLNRSWYAFTGQSAGEAEGYGWLNATHPDDKARSETAFVTANADRTPFRLEYRLRRADGVYRWALDAASPRYGPKGEYLGYIGSVIDIDDRRESEDRIRESEARFRTLTDVMPAFVWFATADGELQFLNDRWYAYSGLTPEQSLVREWRSALHPDDRERTREAWSASLANGVPYTIKVRFRRRDGAYLWFLSRAEPLRDADGRVTAWFGTTVDIDEGERARVALQENEQRYRLLAAERSAIVSQLAEGVIVTDEQGRITFVNAAATQLHGVARLDVAPEAYAETYHLVTEDGRPFPFEQLPLSRAVRGEVVLDARWRIRRPDGAEVIAIGGARPLLDEDGVQFGAVLTVRDDTARRTAEAELRHLNATLEQRVAAEVAERVKTEEQLRQAQKMEAVGQLTGGIAHDFNNLLAGIVGSLDMLQRRVQQGRTDGLDRYTATAMASAQRAAALTQRLLAFARRQPLDPKPVETNRLLASMEELLRRTLGPATELEMVLSGGLWPTLCDPNQLESALLNLAINARDSMPEGGRLTIETANSHLDEAYARAHAGELRSGQYVVICVTDTGSGMSPDVLEKAFDPFFTTKPIGQGTGLGLSMLYGFVKQSDGHVKIYSEEGQGTTFRIYLPRWRGDLLVAVPEEPQAAGHQAEAGETVLIVEDEPSVRMLVLETLIDLGYTAVEAADGPAGLRILESDQRLDLLVTDVGLPGLNGRQLADAARVKRPELKVLFITGYAHNAAVGNGVLEQGMEMMTKPFSIDALGLKIRQMIESG